MNQTRFSAPALAGRESLLLGASGAWTLFIWVTRVRLAVADGTAVWTDWARIVISMMFGLALIAIAVNAKTGTRSRRGAAIMIGFAFWMVLVWVPSIIGVLAGDRSSSFKAVHGLLAIGSLTSGALIGGLARREILFYPRATSSQAAASNSTK